MTRLCLAAVFLFLLGASPGVASWGTSCAPAVAGMAPSNYYVWRKQADGNYKLFHNSRQVGTYHSFEGVYTRSDGTKATPPIRLPQSVREATPKNFGVQLDKLDRPSSPQYNLNGKKVSRDKAYAAVQKNAPTLPDDSRKNRLTVIGSKEECAPVLHDFAISPELAPFRDQVCIQDYRPDSWELDCGFVKTGKPTIYYQQPDGKVLHRQDDYAGGATAFAAALRKADPNYKPAADPDKRKDSPLNIPQFPEDYQMPLLLLGGAALLFLFFKR